MLHIIFKEPALNPCVAHTPWPSRTNGEWTPDSPTSTLTLTLYKCLCKWTNFLPWTSPLWCFVFLFLRVALKEEPHYIGISQAFTHSQKLKKVLSSSRLSVPLSTDREHEQAENSHARRRSSFYCWACIFSSINNSSWILTSHWLQWVTSELQKQSLCECEHCSLWTKIHSAFWTQAPPVHQCQRQNAHTTQETFSLEKT